MKEKQRDALALHIKAAKLSTRYRMLLIRQILELIYSERQAGSKSANIPQSPQNDVRSKLRKAGLLASPVIRSEELEYADDSELEALGTLPQGARPSEELIAEDRGD